MVKGLYGFLIQKRGTLREIQRLILRMEEEKQFLPENFPLDDCQSGFNAPVAFGHSFGRVLKSWHCIHRVNADFKLPGEEPGNAVIG